MVFSMTIEFLDNIDWEDLKSNLIVSRVNIPPITGGTFALIRNETIFPVPLSQIKLNDSFENVLPKVDRKTREDMKSSLISVGQMNPLILWDKDDTLVDGYTRYHIMEEINSVRDARSFNTVNVERWDFIDEDEIVAFIWTNQYSRRNTNKYQEVLGYYQNVYPLLRKYTKAKQGQQPSHVLDSMLKILPKNLKDEIESSNEAHTHKIISKIVGGVKSTTVSKIFTIAKYPELTEKLNLQFLYRFIIQLDPNCFFYVKIKTSSHPKCRSAA